MRYLQFFLLLFLMACDPAPHATPPQATPVVSKAEGTVLRAGFLALETVFNSELMAPYDVLHHSIFRDSENYIEPFIVTPDGKPFVTFEGI